MSFPAEEEESAAANYRETKTSEIEEENSSGGGGDLFEIREELEGSLFSVDVRRSRSSSSGGGEDCVYVCVGKSDSSVDAVSWTLNNLNNKESTLLYLIHVFPEIRHVPSPLGKLPRNQVSPEQLELYMAQERGKRRELLHKFINMCSASKVKVETILIESDMVAKAILDLIPILNIRKLVLGTTKSNLRKLRSKRGNGIVDQILQNAASEVCEIKIICDGKEVNEIVSPSPSPLTDVVTQSQDQSNTNDSFSCICFKSPRVT